MNNYAFLTQSNKTFIGHSYSGLMLSQLFSEGNHNEITTKAVFQLMFTGCQPYQGMVALNLFHDEEWCWCKNEPEDPF